MTRKIMIVGDSHTDAIKRAIKLRKGAFTHEISAQRFSKIKNGEPFGDISLEDVEAVAGQLDPSDLLVSTVGGNQHQVFGLIQHPQPFDFHLPDTALPMQSGSETIPYRVLWDVFSSGLRGRDGATLRRLRAATQCRLVHLTPPPPKEDEAHILRRFETHFAKHGLAEQGVTAAPVRLKLWHLQVRALQELCAEIGITLLPPPAGTQTEDGYLKPTYYADDATHANGDYGILVLLQLEEVADRVLEQA